MKPRLMPILLISLALAISACATAVPAAPTPAPAATSMPPKFAAAAADSGGRSLSSQTEPAAAAVNRLVVKNAELSIVVTDPIANMANITTMANTMGGYVVSSKSYTTRSPSGVEVPQANVVVRVPAEKLDTALETIHKLTQDPSRDVRSENVTGQDVTADYVDLQSRLTSLQNTQAQLIKIQDSATKTEDVMNVFNRLSDVNQQIEQTKGRIKFYEESAALSSINVTLLSTAGVAPLQIGGWQPVGIIRDAFQALIDVGKFLLSALIWLVIFFVPLGLVLFFPGRWIWRFVRRRIPRGGSTTLSSSAFPPASPAGPSSPPPQYPEIK